MNASSDTSRLGEAPAGLDDVPPGIAWLRGPHPRPPAPMEPGLPDLRAGQVVTWLPDGRWVTDPDKPDDDRVDRNVASGRIEVGDHHRPARGDPERGRLHASGRPPQPDSGPRDPGRGGLELGRRPDHGSAYSDSERGWPGLGRRPDHGSAHSESERGWRELGRRPDHGSAHSDSERGWPGPGRRHPEPAERARRWGRRRVRLARVGARLAGWPRRVVIGVLLVAAAVLALRPESPQAPAAAAGATQHVVVAARDLAAGTELAASDLRIVSMPVAIVPSGSSPRAAGLIGRVAAGAIRRGEALTDARVVGPGLAAGLSPEESAAVPVRIADPDATALVRVGDRVDVLGTPVAPDGTQATAGQTITVAAAVRVLAVLRSRDPADGVVLVVGTGEAAARTLAGAAVRHRLTVNLRPP